MGCIVVGAGEDAERVDAEEVRARELDNEREDQEMAKRKEEWVTEMNRRRAMEKEAIEMQREMRRKEIEVSPEDIVQEVLRLKQEMKTKKAQQARDEYKVQAKWKRERAQTDVSYVLQCSECRSVIFPQEILLGAIHQIIEFFMYQDRTAIVETKMLLNNEPVVGHDEEIRELDNRFRNNEVVNFRDTVYHVVVLSQLLVDYVEEIGGLLSGHTVDMLAEAEERAADYRRILSYHRSNSYFDKVVVPFFLMLKHVALHQGLKDDRMGYEYDAQRHAEQRFTETFAPIIARGVNAEIDKAKTVVLLLIHHSVLIFQPIWPSMFPRPPNVEDMLDPCARNLFAHIWYVESRYGRDSFEYDYLQSTCDLISTEVDFQGADIRRKNRAKQTSERLKLDEERKKRKEEEYRRTHHIEIMAGHEHLTAAGGEAEARADATTAALDAATATTSGSDNDGAAAEDGSRQRLVSGGDAASDDEDGEEDEHKTVEASDSDDDDDADLANIQINSDSDSVSGDDDDDNDGAGAGKLSGGARRPRRRRRRRPLPRKRLQGFAAPVTEVNESESEEDPEANLSPEERREKALGEILDDSEELELMMFRASRLPGPFVLASPDNGDKWRERDFVDWYIHQVYSKPHEYVPLNTGSTTQNFHFPCFSCNYSSMERTTDSAMPDEKSFKLELNPESATATHTLLKIPVIFDEEQLQRLAYWRLMNIVNPDTMRNLEHSMWKAGVNVRSKWRMDIQSSRGKGKFFGRFIIEKKHLIIVVLMVAFVIFKELYVLSTYEEPEGKIR